MMISILGLTGFYIATEIIAHIINEKASNLLFNNDLEVINEKQDAKSFTEELNETDKTSYRKIMIEGFIEIFLAHFPITNIFLAYDSYIDVKQYIESEVVNIANEGKTKTLEKTDRKKKKAKEEVTPVTIVLKYQEQKRSGEILYCIKNGIPKIINAIGELNNLSLLEQAALVRNEYQEFKNNSDETWRKQIDEILEASEELNNLEDFLDRENVFICNLQTCQKGKMQLEPLQINGSKSKIDQKVLKKNNRGAKDVF